MNGSIKDWLWRKAGNKSVKIRKRMERIQEIFFFLLRRGLWGEEQPVQENLFPLSSSEWDLIYRLSRKHTLQGIIYDGIVGLPAGCQPPKMLLIHWTVEIDKWERINRHQQQILSRLQILFSQPPAIPFELIKGPAISCFYRNPLHRVCGDLDLYFCGKEQVEAANKRIEQTGIRVERGMTGDSAYLINGALIEQHSRLIELHNPFFQKELTQWEKQVFTTGKPEQRPVYYGVPVTVPTPVAHQLLVSTHILKHLLNAGIGLRQLCDAAVLLRAQYEILDKKELEERCRRLGVYRWSQLLYALLVKYIGLPERYLPFPTDENPDTLMEEVWESGNFGFYDERKAARPEGKWKNKWYTVKQIGRKAKLFYLYAPGETFWWPVLLSGVRIMELIQGK